MKLENLWIAGLTLSLVFALGFGYYANILNNYGHSSDEAVHFDEIDDLTGDLNSQSLGMKDDIQGGDVSDQDAENAMFAGGYKGVRSRPATVQTLLSDQVTVIEHQTTSIIPPAVFKWGYAVLGILVTFAVIYLIFRVNK